MHDDERDAERLVRRSALKGLLLTGAVAAGGGVAAPFLIPLLFGEDFDAAARPLALLLPGIVAYAPVTILVVYLSVRHGRPNLSLAVSLLAMVVTTVGALLLIGALQYVAFDPTVLGAFTALPVQIYTWVKLPDPQFQTLAAGAIVVLLGIVLTMNALAIFLRSRFRQNW